MKPLSTLYRLVGYQPIEPTPITAVSNEIEPIDQQEIVRLFKKELSQNINDRLQLKNYEDVQLLLNLKTYFNPL